MRIAVMNCNTSSSMTDLICEGARLTAARGTEIVPLQPLWGPESAEGWYDSFITAAAGLDRLATLEFPIDGLVMAGFGEHGREGARELLDVPVLDITEAAAMLALPLGQRYGVITTLDRSVVQIEESLRSAGLIDHCAAIYATGLGVLELEEDVERTQRAFIEAGRRALEEGAEVLCLGCAGMTGLEKRVRGELGVPVIDGVAAAVGIIETLLGLGLTTSKVGGFATPRAKLRVGWPVSARPRT